MFSLPAGKDSKHEIVNKLLLSLIKTIRTVEVVHQPRSLSIHDPLAHFIVLEPIIHNFSSW